MKKFSKGMFLSLAGAIILLLQTLGLKIDVPYVNEIIEAVCAVLIALGIVTTATDKSEEKQEDTKNSDAPDGTDADMDEDTKEDIKTDD